MNTLNRFGSVAVFGSVARGEADSLSDRDLLVVSDHRALAEDLEALRAQGYSPAAYTWRSLEALAKYRSLFLLHLKFESKVIKDGNFRLSKFLATVAPSDDYSVVLKQSVDLAALTTSVPDVEVLRLWAADVLAVALRNYLVALAAQRGRYIFSYSSLVDFAETLFRFDSSEKSALLNLRTWKACYRQKGYEFQLIAPSYDELQSAQDAISSIVGLNIYAKQIGVSEFSHRLMNKTNSSEPWYHSVRRYEGVYRSIDPWYFTAPVVKAIESQIASPCCYMDDGQVLWKVLRDQVQSGYAKSLN